MKNHAFIVHLLRIGSFAALLPGLWCCTPKSDTSSNVATAGQTASSASDRPMTKPATVAKKVVLFYGNSLAAGLGVEPDEAFPARVGEKIDSAGLNYEVINAGLSGETTAGGLSRISWVLRRPADVFVLELGGNDGLRGIPPNMGQAYTAQFRQLFRELATRNRLTLIPFLLEGVGGDPKLNQPDGIHPTPTGHRIVAATVWTVLQPLLTATDRSGT
jgi:acyl-CoA thioesterase I